MDWSAKKNYVGMSAAELQRWMDAGDSLAFQENSRRMRTVQRRRWLELDK